MGNTLKKLLELVAIAAIMTVLGLVCYQIYPSFSKKISSSTYNIKNYTYKPATSVQSEVDTSKLPAANAVPILMYHGILYSHDENNTELKNFVSQMEMLKRNGYETITLAEFENFLDNKFTLPAKPIILTFDDGRKDSYFPTNDVLKKLGFKATLFMVSGKANDHDNFYLSWRELKEMKESGIWDIEAHGQYSHVSFPIDSTGNKGYFLTSRIQDKKTGLESIEAFKARVENDYVSNIADIEKNLGYKPNYYAIPLNDYGGLANSNFPESEEINKELSRKYFKMSFVQANGGTGDSLKKLRINPYNYRDADKYEIYRIEVKNLSANDILNLLNEYAPKEPELDLREESLNILTKQSFYSFGNLEFKDNVLHLFGDTNNDTTRIVIGDSHWKNYSVETTVQRYTGRSVSLLAYFKNNENYLSFGITDNGIFLRETLEGETKELVSPYIFSFGLNKNYHTFKLEIKDSNITAYLDNAVIFQNVKTSLTKGATGINVWSDNPKVSVNVKSLKLFPLQ